MNSHARLRRSLLTAGLVVLFAASSGAGTTHRSLLDLLHTPFQTVQEFEDWLRALESRLLERDDSRAVFAAMYLVLTQYAAQAMADGVFEDEAWAEELTLSFGNLYRQAFLDYETGRFDFVPRAWMVAFETAEANESSVFMDALLGVHAHVNHDLAFAIASVTPPGERRERFVDYYQTNVAIIVASIEEVESMLAEDYDERLGKLDEALGAVDERLVKSVLTRWRFRAWRRAALFDGSLPPDEAEAWARYVDLLTGAQAYRILTNPLVRFIGGDDRSRALRGDTLTNAYKAIVGEPR